MPLDDPFANYETATENLDNLGTLLERLISELLTNANISVHNISFRVKTKESAGKKLAGRPDRYSSIQDLTDLLGIRIVTYFSNEVDLVAAALLDEFRIDSENSIDKREALSPDQFGYLSLHYIAQLGESRESLIEYKRFAGQVFEIQIRSILQHAWAEIEHDLGYKANGTLHPTMKRKFSRLAGLLEVADDEFVNIRTSLSAIEQRVTDKIEASDPLPSVPASDSIGIDQSSVRALLNTADLTRLDHQLAHALGAPLERKINGKYISRQITHLEKLGITDLDTLRSSIGAYRAHLVEFARKYSSARPEDQETPQRVLRGVTLETLIACIHEAAGDEDLPPEMPQRMSASRKGQVHDAWRYTVEKLGDPILHPKPGTESRSKTK